MPYRLPSARIQGFAGFLDLGGQEVFVGQGKMVFPRQDFVGKALEGVFCHGYVVLGSQN